MMRRNKQQCKTFYEGMLFKTNNDGDLIVTKYVSNQEVHIKFVETGYKTKVRMDNLIRGKVKDYLNPSLYGIGIIGCEISTKERKSKIFSYWKNMLKRCYCDKSLEVSPSYEDCQVTENFRNYQYFKEWCFQQIGFEEVDRNGKSFQLDKDILVKGNRIYSEDTCCFVPKEINMFSVIRAKDRGECLIGVGYKPKSVKKFRARCGNKYLGLFNTELEAFYAYKQAKETYIKEVANKWKDQIDPRVYDALMKYEVEITD